MAPALRRAASIASERDGRVANTPKSGEATDVKSAMTVADLECQEALLETLWEHFPEVSLRAEEDTPTVLRFPKNGDATVVIDPIDGTLHFYLKGGGPYAIMVGLAVEDRYRAALVALPRDACAFEGFLGGGARFIDAEGVRHPAVLHAEARCVLVSHGLAESAVAVLRGRGYDVKRACGGAISVAPMIPGVCAGLRVATNNPKNVSIRGRVGVMIAAEAGAQMATETGDPFPSDLSTPSRTLLVAADRDHLAALKAAVDTLRLG